MIPFISVKSYFREKGGAGFFSWMRTHVDDSICGLLFIPDFILYLSQNIIPEFYVEFCICFCDMYFVKLSSFVTAFVFSYHQTTICNSIYLASTRNLSSHYQLHLFSLPQGAMSVLAIVYVLDPRILSQNFM